MTHYAMHDAQFNIAGLIAGDGNVVERYEYDAYGRRTVLDADFSDDADNTSDFDFQFGHQGLMHDAETGLIHNRNRMRHPTLGRFMQRDPLGYVDGMSVYAAYHCIHVAVDPFGLDSPECSCETRIRHKVVLPEWRLEGRLGGTVDIGLKATADQLADSLADEVTDTLLDKIKEIATKDISLLTGLRRLSDIAGKAAVVDAAEKVMGLYRASAPKAPFVRKVAYVEFETRPTNADKWEPTETKTFETEWRGFDNTEVPRNQLWFGEYDNNMKKLERLLREHEGTLDERINSKIIDYLESTGCEHLESAEE